MSSTSHVVLYIYGTSKFLRAVAEWNTIDRNKTIFLIGPFRIINGPLINADRCINILAQVLHSLMPFAPNLPILFVSLQLSSFSSS